MFAQRFDPAAVAVTPKAIVSRKRKASSSESEEESGSSDSGSSDSDSSDSSSSDSSSSDSSSSDSSSSDSEDSSSDSDSDSETENGENKPSSTESLDSMDIDQNPDQMVDQEMEDQDRDMKQQKSSDSAPTADSGVSESAKEEVSNDPDYVSKHSAIFQKFQKSAQKEEAAQKEEDEEEEIAETQDLAPLPQPELPTDSKLVSTGTHQKNLDWLATPHYVDPEIKEPFANLGISEQVLKNLREMGFVDAFSVQVGTLRFMMEDIRKNRFAPDFRGDLLVNASTGSGKTLAYSIPVVEALCDRIVPRVRAIILVPTKPLITQVTQTIRDLSKGTTLSVVSLTNDLSIKEEGLKITTNVPDVLVSTPGRLVEHLLNNSISLEALRFLIIDEADRLLNQSFQNWSEVVVSNIDKWVDPALNTSNIWRLQTQKLIFSATLTTDAGKLALLKFNSPRLLVVNSSQQLVSEMFSVPATLSEYRIKFSSSKSAIKPLILAKFMMQANKLSNVLVFANSNDATLRLSKVLQILFNRLIPNRNVSVAYINSTNNIASVRGRILKDFSENKVQVLVATDLIARGLDILSITDVINYDLPNSSREYVHRVGRTARANNSGNAYTLCFGKGEDVWFQTIMRDVGRSKPIEELDENSEMVVDSMDKSIFDEVMEGLQK